jgi:hypothetical protein
MHQFIWTLNRYGVTNKIYILIKNVPLTGDVLFCILSDTLPQRASMFAFINASNFAFIYIIMFFVMLVILTRLDPFSFKSVNSEELQQNILIITFSFVWPFTMILLVVFIICGLLFKLINFIKSI